MFRKTIIMSVILLLLFVVGCGSKGYDAYLGKWENVNEVDDYILFVKSFTISESGDHLVFDIVFADDSGGKFPATFDDGYFKVRISTLTWSAFHDKDTGYLIMENQQFRKTR